METAVKTLKEEVIDYLTESENGALFEAVKLEIDTFENFGTSVKEYWETIMVGDRDLSEGRVVTTEQVKAHLEARKSQRQNAWSGPKKRGHVARL